MQGIGDFIAVWAKFAKESPCIKDFILGGKDIILNGVRKKNDYFLLGLEPPYISDISDKSHRYNSSIAILGYAGRDCPDIGMDILIQAENILHNIINRFANGSKFFEHDIENPCMQFGVAEVICDSYADGVWGLRVDVSIKSGKPWCVDKSCWNVECPELIPSFNFHYAQDAIILENESSGFDSFEWFIIDEKSKLKKEKENIVRLEEEDFIDSSGCMRSLEIILKVQKLNCCKFSRIRLWCLRSKGKGYLFCPQKDDKTYEKLFE